MYTQFRADGWPLCPACGQDGLWMLHIQPQGDGPPKLLESIEKIEGCALCEWEPEDAILAPILAEVVARIERSEIKTIPWEVIKAELIANGMLDQEHPHAGQGDRMTR